MGSQNSYMDVIFDNASDWLIVEGNDCINCEGKTFNIDNSSSAKQIGTSFSQRSYGAASMVGSEWTDLVCVTLQACISDFEFFLISEQEGLKSNVDGVLGLSRNKPFFQNLELGIKRGPSYMLALENAGLISENTFSFYLAPFGEESTIDFGAPKDDRMADPSQLTYISLNHDYFWSTECDGFAIGSTENQWAWGSIKGEEGTINKGAVYSIFDTGASAIIFPSAFFGNFLKELYNEMSGDEYELSKGYVVSKCYNDFPNLYFNFNHEWIAVEPKDYVIDVSDSQDRSICVLLLSQGEAPFLIMGLPLYMDYYTVHDDTNNRIGFAPRSGANKEAIFSGPKPRRVFESTSPSDPIVNIWSWIISGFIVFSFIGL